jgi:hypothetical protein
MEESPWPEDLQWIVGELEESPDGPARSGPARNGQPRNGHPRMVLSGVVLLERESFAALEAMARSSGWRYRCDDRALSFLEPPRLVTFAGISHFTSGQDDLVAVELRLRVHP